MKKETIKKILNKKTIEEKQILNEMIHQQTSVLSKFKEGNDFEKYYKRLSKYQKQEKKPVSKPAQKQKTADEEVLPFIESANSAIQRLLPANLELQQTSKASESGEKIIVFQILDNLEPAFEILVFLDSGIISDKSYSFKDSEMTRKVVAIFKPYFKAR